MIQPIKNHVMIDLETWGKIPDCALRSIGAVIFDPIHGTLDDSFYVNISRESCEKHHLHIDANTETWWSRQSPEAQDALLTDQHDLYDALMLFTDWWRAQHGVYFWAHSPNFDESILSAAYRAIGAHVPWEYSKVRCTRTIYDLANVQPDRSKGVHHNALVDAENQALAVHDAYVKLGLAAQAEVQS